uniref:Uncharacterized protein LOC111134984 n=1 Tax=Crassostrea virginica TaxID=6565 RepID=A0A8B8EJR4_CRAVI|nr:uncharacterized protein LOC111134984 [Crassostrea virginica]XP_022340331.1 uncharacterized protein LOC111134984 [Crassostrea virginica]
MLANMPAVVLGLVCLLAGYADAIGVLGGGTCTIPAVGTDPGASGTCTGTANGFCLINHLTVTGTPVTAVNYDGVCVCYSGYSGSQCATATSSSSTGLTNAVGAVALGGLGAYVLSQLGPGQTALGIGPGPQAAQEAFYIQQATG